jgi:hypothetical protein
MVMTSPSCRSWPRAVKNIGGHGSELNLDRYGAAVGHIKLFRCPLRYVERSAFRVRAAIVNTHAHRAPVLQVSDQSSRLQRYYCRRRRQLSEVQLFSSCSLTPCGSLSIPGSPPDNHVSGRRRFLSACATVRESLAQKRHEHSQWQLA